MRTPQDLVRSFTARLGEEPDGAGGGVSAARTLAAMSSEQCSRWLEPGDPGVSILAEHERGVLYVIRLAVGAVGTPSRHGAAGALRVVSGSVEHRRFRLLSDDEHALESIHRLGVGDVAFWGDPPDDVTCLDHVRGSTETTVLVLAASHPPTGHLHRPTIGAPVESTFRSAVTAAFIDGDAAQLAPWYAPDVLVDANVPDWRFQASGSGAALDLLREDFGEQDRRLTQLRLTDTAEGLLAEIEAHFTETGQLRRSRQVHQFRLRDGLVAEHVIWCSGVWDQVTIDRQLAEAPMLRY